MKVILFGASGMVGLGILRECLLGPYVTAIVSVERADAGPTSPKLRRIIRKDLFNLAPIEKDLAGFDVCIFTIGVSAAGLDETAYSRMNYDLPISVASTVARLNPGMTFCYVSGQGTDSSEKGKSMWARVKGRTENALLKLPFKAAYMFRPGLIVPLHGIRSKTTWYNLFYAIFAPILALAYRALPNKITTTERLGRAMLEAAKHGAPKPILETADIQSLYLKSLSPGEASARS